MVSGILTEQPAYAGFWRRVGASIIDSLLLLPFILALLYLAISMPEISDPGRAVSLLTLPLSMAYYVIGNGLGGTLGKRWTGLRVVDEDGQAPGLRRGFVRYLIPVTLSLLGLIVPSDGFGILGFVSLLALLDPLWMIWDPEKQTLHDKLAGTYVIEA